MNKLELSKQFRRGHKCSIFYTDGHSNISLKTWHEKKSLIRIHKQHHRFKIAKTFKYKSSLMKKIMNTRIKEKEKKDLEKGMKEKTDFLYKDINVSTHVSCNSYGDSIKNS